MKSKVLSLILAVCTLCSLLVSPASAVGGDSAVQMVQALGILDGTDLESPGGVFQNAGGSLLL